jgi:hypothetical protein
MRRSTMTAVLVACCLGAGCAQERVDVPVPRPEPLLGMNTGGGFSSYIISSHLQTGWARYLETVPALRLKEGIGSWTACQQLREPEDADRILGTLHRYGVSLFRYEIGWGNTEYRDDLTQPMRLNARTDSLYRAALRASKRSGFRLIVLLNAHQGQPCGVRYAQAKALADVRAGAATALFDIPDRSMIAPGYAAVNELTHYCAAEGLFRSLTPRPDAGPNAYLVTITKPFAKDIAQGAEVGLARLQYRPFGDPATDQQTYTGWGQYADLLARIASEEGLEDGEVDFEIWNEMSFGTSFLSIENYDPSLKGEFDANQMLQLAATAIRRYFPARTNVINGFANTSFFFNGFWGSARPAGVNAESYHPYGNQWRSFPDFAEGKQAHLREAYRNADGFVPAYGMLFPEYKGNYVDSHDLICLMQPEMREQLVTEGHAPPGWKRYMTENGLFLNEVKPPEPYATRMDAQPERYVAKYWLRMYPFYLNKGLSGVCDGSLRNPGDWKESWEAKFVETGDESHLKAMLPLRRMAALVEQAIDVPPDRLIQLHPRVSQLSGWDKVIFGAEGALILTALPKGESVPPWDPSKVKPRPLTYRDVFCLLPFQIDDSALAIAAYIQTRNILEDVPDAGRYEIAFPGLKADADTVRVYDPLDDRDVPAEVTTKAGALSITLTLTDCPVWIILRNVDGPRGGGPITATEGSPPYS